MKISSYSHKRGFTLIELLTVIAIIGILAGILIPVVGASRVAANKAKTKAQFANYANALVQYKAEYGYWPSVGGSAASPDSGLSSGATVNLATDSLDFMKAMTGRDPSTAANNKDTEFNRRAISFLSISDDELFRNPDDSIDQDQLADSFNNPNIKIRVDHDNDGRITGLPAVDSIGTTINAKVAIWVRKGGAAENDTETGDGYESIYSWN